MKQYRHNTWCPKCRRTEAVFVASAGNGLAMYRCMNVLSKTPCGHWFTQLHPKPLPEHRNTTMKEAA